MYKSFKDRIKSVIGTPINVCLYSRAELSVGLFVSNTKNRQFWFVHVLGDKQNHLIFVCLVCMFV